MIEFLTAAFLVLRVRGEKIVKTLESKKGVPSTVVDRCRSAAQYTCEIIDGIDDKIDNLALIAKSLESGKISSEKAEKPLKTVLLAYRDLRRTMDSIEEHFVGHIVRYNDSDLFFTRLAETLWEETNLPDPPPIAVTNTSEYFCTWASLGIIFSPPSTEHNLLIYPDLYHEFAHILQESIELIGASFRNELRTHVAELRNQVRRFARPMDGRVIDDINYKWGKKWGEEVACDTLAACVVGPAYGWCNLHLCLQNSSAFLPTGAHPADAARTKHILRVLRRRGFGEDAAKIENLWNRFAEISQQSPSGNYHDYHPDSLFIAVMEDVEEAIKANSITGIKEGNPTISMFNEAWKIFNENNAGYYEWEEETIKGLNKKFGIASAE